MSNSVIDAQLTLLEWQHNIVVCKEFEDDYPLLYNNKVCSVHFNSKESAIFDCEDKGYIWKKPNILYLMSDKAYINLLLKIDTIERQTKSTIKNVQL